jgi:hypothetical protein
MTNSTHSSLWKRHRAAITVAALVVAAGLWYLFRPEKLFINKQVNESAPAALAAIQPLFTGSIHSAGGGTEITGRASVLKTAGGLELEISNLHGTGLKSLTVALAESDQDPQPSVLGTVSPGATKLPIPVGIDPAKSKEVMLLTGSHQVLAQASLESF